MGITIRCEKTHTSHDLGCLGFLNLREKVAELCSPEFGEHYKTLFYIFAVGGDKTKFYKEFDKKTAELLERKVVSVKVVDFCLQPDCEGKIRYGACKEIYKHIKDYDDNVCYGYSGRQDCMMFKDFIELVKECYDNKSDLVWD